MFLVILFLGSPEYTVTMHDPRAPALRWNTTYRRYSAPPMDGSPGKCKFHLSLVPSWSKVPSPGNPEQHPRPIPSHILTHLTSPGTPYTKWHTPDG